MSPSTASACGSAPTSSTCCALAQNEGKLLTHRALLREVWGPAYQVEAHYLHVYVSQLRRKIEPEPSSPRYILTEPGAGYRLVAPTPSTR